MVKIIIAVTTAALIATAIVAFIPPPGPAAASSETDIPSLAIATVAAAPIPAASSAPIDISCTQAWPYYEQSCLRNNRQQNDKTRVVRVIADDKTVANRTLRRAAR